MEVDPDTSSDSSTSHSGEDDDAVLQEKINLLREQLDSCPTLYESHVELISLLRQLGNLEELRNARENMHLVYPLSPRLWLDWFEDELKIASSAEEKRNIEGLFKRAIEDYDDPSIWLEYCLFVIGQFSPQSPESIRAVEDVFELALSHQGLNVVSGSSVWDAYRDFQMVLLEHFKVNSAQSVEEHVKRMDRLFRRQLRIPLLSIQSTFKAYEEFLGQYWSFLCGENNQETSPVVPAECIKEYKEALAQLELLQPFEDKIETFSEDEASSVSAWTTYLDWIVSDRQAGSSAAASGKSKVKSSPKGFDPAHICCLFERAITAHCLHAAIWLRFINYLTDKVPSDKPRILRVLARSTRNCPWSVDLWIQYGLVSESVAHEEVSTHTTNGLNVQTDPTLENTTFAKVTAVYETALSAGFQQASDLLQLWFNYCAFGVRRLLRMEPSTPEWNDTLENLRLMFERSHQSLREMFRDEADPDDTLYRFHAFVEAKYAHDLGKARSVWSRLMQQPGRGSKAILWLTYLDFERNWGDAKHFLRVARMAINSIGKSEAEHAFASLLQLSCQVGLEVVHLMDLKSRIRHRLHELEQQATCKGEQNADAGAVEPKHGRKRHATEGVPSAFKKPKVTQNTSQQASDQPKSSANVSKQHGEFVPHDPSKDDRTVFVSNLDYRITGDDLRTAFEPCGVLSSVRLVRDYAGRSKGFAYVEFEDIAAAKAALRKDRESIGSDTSFGRPMFVSPCDPKREKLPAFPFTTGQTEPEKLFIRNLDKSISKEVLEELFGKYGTVVSVRLATYRNGAPKGHAYVEFSNADEASRALVATDGIPLGSRNISVAISCPPVKNPLHNQNTTANLTNKFDVASGRTSGVKLDTGPTPRPHARTKLAFLPRSVHYSAATSAPSSSQTENQSNEPRQADSRTNEDFRKLFLS